MKKRVRVQPSNQFYSNEPAVSRKLIADQGMTQNASLGNAPPKIVPKKPGRLSGIAGFSSKTRPAAKNTISVPKFGSTAKSPAQGHLRMSGHPGAHRVGGGIKPIKLKV